mmetsp:Transcript_4516/g.11768  ORF Transcript_4516/g.11768 Transcript_4516/m.11768 type:complete len:242 (-) Transcript_4516:68-793(-)
MSKIREEKLLMREGMNQRRVDVYRNVWEDDLCGTCHKSPAMFLYAVFCPPCISYTNRVDALHGDMRFYTCCQGLLPCSGRMMEHKCPQFCLCMETTCCFPSSVLATRYLLQDEMQIQNTQCDNYLISVMVGLQFLSCFCHIAAMFARELEEAANIIDCAADMVYCSVCACMQAQHKKQIEVRNANPQLTCPVMGDNPLLAPPVQVMKEQPDLRFQYPVVAHTTNAPVQQQMATGYPVSNKT